MNLAAKAGDRGSPAPRDWRWHDLQALGATVLRTLDKEAKNTTKTRILRAAAAVCLAAALGPAAAQGLVGDTLTFNRAYPTPTTPYWATSTKATTVTADANDSGLTVSTSFVGRVLDVNLLGNNAGGSTGFTVAVTVVPEPGTWARWLGGLAGLRAATRARRARSARC